MTRSETLFEKFCANSGIKCVPIHTGGIRTPDYELTIDGQRVIVEVKEIDRNKNEQESLRNHGREEGHGTPGDRVRGKIKKASGQIKALTEGIYPSILVLFDLTWGGHLDPYYIRVAMYGLEQIHMKVPRNPSISPYATGMSYGPERKMTKDDNTSISAIGVLRVPGPNKIMLEVYHNRYASVELEMELLAKYGIPQFKLEDDLPGSTAKWKELRRCAMRTLHLAASRNCTGETPVPPG
jgi:hypothetical protein